MSNSAFGRPFVKDEDRWIGVPSANQVDVEVTAGLIKKYLANAMAHRPLQILVHGFSPSGIRVIVENLVDDMKALQVAVNVDSDQLKMGLALNDIVVIDTTHPDTWGRRVWEVANDEWLGHQGVIIWMCTGDEAPEAVHSDIRINLMKMTHNEAYRELKSLFVNANACFIDKLVRSSKKDIWEIDELVRLLNLERLDSFNLAAYDTVFGIDTNPLDVDDSNGCLDDDDDLDDYLIDDDEDEDDEFDLDDEDDEDDDEDEKEDEVESDDESNKKDDGFDL